MKTSDNLTVLIPTRDRWQLLARCLDSLRAQTIVPKILVVDDASTDDTTTQLQCDYPDCGLVVLEKQHGFAAAVNRGLAEIETKFIGLLNNDTVAHPSWVEVGLQALETQENFHFFASRMLQLKNENQLDGAGDCYDRRGMPYKRGFGSRFDAYPIPDEVLGASAGAAFYRSELFEEVGLFDESFYMYLEDVDFSLRARLAGFRCRYLPDAIVYHLHAGSDPGRGTSLSSSSGHYSKKTVFWITRNRFLLMWIYQPIRHFPSLTFGWMKSLLFHLLKVGHTMAFLRGLASGIRHSGTALRKRRSLKKKYPVYRWKKLWMLIREC